MENKRQSLRIVSYIILALCALSIINLIVGLSNTGGMVADMQKQFADAGINIELSLITLIVNITTIALGSIGILINVFVGLKGLSAAKGKAVGKASTVIAIIIVVLNAITVVTGLGNIASQFVSVLSAAAHAVLYAIYVICMKALRKN